MSEQVRVDFDELFSIWDSLILSRPQRGVYEAVAQYFKKHGINNSRKFRSTMRRLGSHINENGGVLIKSKWDNNNKQILQALADARRVMEDTNNAK